MRKTILLIALAIVGIACSAVEDPVIELYATASLGRLHSGSERDLIESLLEPTPESFPQMQFSLALIYFPLPFLGIEAGADLAGVIEADNEGMEPLGCYEAGGYRGGLCLRDHWGTADGLGLSLSIGAGLFYTKLAWHSDLQDLVYPYELLDIEPRLGYYLKPTANLYLGEGLFLSAGALYAYNRAEIKATGKELDGTSLMLTAGLGFSVPRIRQARYR